MRSTLKILASMLPIIGCVLTLGACQNKLRGRHQAATHHADAIPGTSTLSVLIPEAAIRKHGYQVTGLDLTLNIGGEDRKQLSFNGKLSQTRFSDLISQQPLDLVATIRQDGKSILVSATTKVTLSPGQNTLTMTTFSPASPAPEAETTPSSHWDGRTFLGNSKLSFKSID